MEMVNMHEKQLFVDGKKPFFIISEAGSVAIYLQANRRELDRRTWTDKFAEGGNVTLSHTEKTKIIAAKYSAMMAPNVVTLERRLASTYRKPETPHEMCFLNEYIGHIKEAITNFKTPNICCCTRGCVETIL
ncbi:hypothetical protein CTI12_AA324010 [Artemisia annua]|uniref:Strawberry notch helicase C domain-containing protein n=1 Tax=Artemisia annua TaxID=35608 RepID=A0A2U1N110_ARTAN|nr:hypothetical protein CTI12_AA324010 [Artemisia annua]